MGNWSDYILKLFQSTLPRRERLPIKSLIPYSFKFQSTLPRRERHSAFAAINPSIVISIHTPTKGATWNNSTHTYTVTAISIHTPTKGATCLNIYKPRKDVNFNPHSHEGSDCRSRTRPTMITVFQSTLPRRERRF